MPTFDTMLDGYGLLGLKSSTVDNSTGTKSVRHRHRHKLKHRFEFLSTLGKGTYGKVKLAREIATGELVAIKSIPKNKIENEEDLKRIKQEIEIMRMLDHPHIIHVIDVFESRDKIVMVMEYANGGELYDYINDDKMTPEDAQKFFRQIVSAVSYCHKLNIAHRDLKLENVLLDENLNVKIADFGLSTLYSDKLLSTYCGSPLYASPEIVNGKPYHGPEADCWSLGVMLYAMVYKTMPFNGAKFSLLRQQITEGVYYEPENKPVASRLIRRLLTVNARNRASISDIMLDPWVTDPPSIPSCFTFDDVKDEKILDLNLSSDSDAERAEEPVAKQVVGILKNSSGSNKQVVNDSYENLAPVQNCVIVKKDSIKVRQKSDSRNRRPRRGILKKHGKYRGADSGLSIDEPISSESKSENTKEEEILDKETSVKTKGQRDSKRDSGIDQDMPACSTNTESSECVMRPRKQFNRNSAVRISKRYSKGKYSSVTQVWETIYNSGVDPIHCLTELEAEVNKGNHTRQESASSTEDLLDILDRENQDILQSVESNHNQSIAATSVHCSKASLKVTSTSEISTSEEVIDLYLKALRIPHQEH
ncbi:NUAK family SNF1-like kinase 1 [Anneissia japonica]|uniref:NUAK family SNF1-like kinase 1 n=1 Tax=Anneissia japonica TaxID=1529436 RepID=UPI0014256AEC|nr:NUAK family SNF1-like kinase 1 [Anneissia japonica]